jgi:hypothetical protein
MPQHFSKRHFITTLLGGIGAYYAGVSPALAKKPDEDHKRAPLEIKTKPIAHFHINPLASPIFGKLKFRGGLVLSADHAAFGGISGLWRAPKGGQQLVAITDAGSWITADVVTEKDRPIALIKGVIAPILSPSGKPVRKTRFYDCEGLSMANGKAYVCVERVQEVLEFEWEAHGINARAKRRAMPKDAKKMPKNKGLEAIAVAPQNSPLKGGLLVISERSDGENAPTKGFILSGPLEGIFYVSRPQKYDISDCAFLKNGDLLLLERWFSLWGGFAVRIRRIAAAQIKPNQTLEGEVIFEADMSHQIDNMEGLSIHETQDGKTVVTLISDDNFHGFQRTLLLEFEYNP